MAKLNSSLSPWRGPKYRIQVTSSALVFRGIYSGPWLGTPELSFASLILELALQTMMRNQRHPQKITILELRSNSDVWISP